jgi:hypothetical protein
MMQCHKTRLQPLPTTQQSPVTQKRLPNPSNIDIDSSGGKGARRSGGSRKSKLRDVTPSA